MTDLNSKTDSNTIVRDLNTQFTVMGRETMNSSLEQCAVNQMGLTDMYRILHPAAELFTFFSSRCRMFFRIDHVKSQKKS